jgi:hypothetical protein
MDVSSATATPLPSLSIMHRKQAGSFTLKEDYVASTEPNIVRRGTRTVYPPLVSSMVRSNTMRDCNQIQLMFLQCQVDSSSRDDSSDITEPFVCRTAKKYHEMCLSGERT